MTEKKRETLQQRYLDKHESQAQQQEIRGAGNRKSHARFANSRPQRQHYNDDNHNNRDPENDQESDRGLQIATPDATHRVEIGIEYLLPRPRQRQLVEEKRTVVVRRRQVERQVRGDG